MTVVREVEDDLSAEAFGRSEFIDGSLKRNENRSREEVRHRHSKSVGLRVEKSSRCGVALHIQLDILQQFQVLGSCKSKNLRSTIFQSTIGNESINESTRGLHFIEPWRKVWSRW